LALARRAAGSTIAVIQTGVFIAGYSVLIAFIMARVSVNTIDALTSGLIAFAGATLGSGIAKTLTR